MGTLTPQRSQALVCANEVRLGRARQKHRIHAGELQAATVILDPARCDEGWPIGQVLMAQRGWGRTRMVQLLSRLRISETRPLGMLTERQRHLLADALDYRVKR